MQISEFPNNIIGFMFRLLQAAMNISNKLIEIFMRTPTEIMSGWLSNLDMTESLREVITLWMNITNPFISNLTLFDITIGGALIIVLIVGVMKYFANAMGL